MTTNELVDDLEWGPRVTHHRGLLPAVALAVAVLLSLVWALAEAKVECGRLADRVAQLEQGRAGER